MAWEYSITSNTAGYVKKTGSLKRITMAVGAGTKPIGNPGKITQFLRTNGVTTDQAMKRKAMEITGDALKWAAEKSNAASTLLEKAANTGVNLTVCLNGSSQGIVGTKKCEVNPFEVLVIVKDTLTGGNNARGIFAPAITILHEIGHVMQNNTHDLYEIDLPGYNYDTTPYLYKYPMRSLGALLRHDEDNIYENEIPITREINATILTPSNKIPIRKSYTEMAGGIINDSYVFPVAPLDLRSAKQAFTNYLTTGGGLDKLGRFSWFNTTIPMVANSNEYISYGKRIKLEYERVCNFDAWNDMVTSFVRTKGSERKKVCAQLNITGTVNVRNYQNFFGDMYTCWKETTGYCKKVKQKIDSNSYWNKCGLAYVSTPSQIQEETANPLPTRAKVVEKILELAEITCNWFLFKRGHTHPNLPKRKACFDFLKANAAIQNAIRTKYDEGAGKFTFDMT